MIDERDEELTELFNRFTMIEYLKDNLRNKDMFIAICDVDFFANINAKVGDEEGNSILYNISKFLKQEIKGTIGRYGGDEFIFALSELEIENVLKIMRELKRKMRKQRFIQNNELYCRVPISCSYGVTFAKRGENVNYALKNAEIALAMAKKKGRNRIEVISDLSLYFMKDKKNFVSTVCGSGLRGYSGDGGEAYHAQLAEPYGVSVGENGEIYIADRGNHCIRKVDLRGKISTVAGCGKIGYTGDYGAAISATLSKPSGVAYEKGGNFYIADTGNHCIRKVDKFGIITTLAGDGSEGKAELEKNPDVVRLSRPGGVAVDVNGYVYTNDYGNNRVLKIDQFGRLIEAYGNSEFGYKGDGEGVDSIRFNKPYGVTVTKNGRKVYIPDYENYCVRCIDTKRKNVSTVFHFNDYDEKLLYGGPYWVDIWKNQILCIADGVKNHIVFYDIDKKAIKLVLGMTEGGYKDAAGPKEWPCFNVPAGVAVDEEAAVLYVADYANNAVRRVNLRML
ncbi:diguanylate cyclase (GGDEF)-like protein [Lachnotalea glycerini]|uniref:Diguanylate cyclase (GGDEF)-like protein n=1 Tax=Lachnotalea glycerini TaxID=1763509 RepID=A0A318EWX1_9FIRM|nr:diguanylate cyclase [Lachnotalea glycerini]PXV95576.1 diguanylate cyclase (GGDEF)-like protein [Lachnotalea glycerini]